MRPPATDWRRRIARGAALLDAKRPGWRDQISPADLDLASCSKCVIGQAFGVAETTIRNEQFRHWHEALITLNDGSWGTSEFTFEHGFDIDPETMPQEAYGDLRAEWISYLKGDA